MATLTGSSAPDAPAPSGDSIPAADLVRDSAALGREIEQVRAEMERSIQLAGLKNDPLAPLLRTLAVSLALQWRLHDQAVSYHRSAGALLDRQLADTVRQGEQALEAQRSTIVEVLAPQLAKMTAHSVRSWNQMVTVRTGVTLGAFAVALAFGVGLAGYGAGWQAGHNTAVATAGALTAALQQAGPPAETALLAMVRANNLPNAWETCLQSATPDKTGRRVCLMPMWAEPQRQPGKG